MKPISRISLLLITLVIMVAAFPGPAYAQTTGNEDGKFVFGGTYTLKSGETLRGGLVVVGGTAELEEDSLVVGDVVVIGGEVNIYDQVDGNVVAIGGKTYLGEKAVVNEDLVTVGGTVQREEGALIRGSITAEMPENFDFGALKPDVLNPETGWRLSSLWKGVRPIGDIMVKFMQALAMAALAAVLALFLLQPMERVSHAVMVQPLVTGGLGLLTIIVVPALLLLLAVTLILIPLSLIGILALGAAFVFGWVAVGLEVGRRMEKMFKVQEPWAPAVSAGVGTLTLSVLSSAIGMVPCVGWMVPFLVAMLSLGGVVVTMFGSRVYPEPAPAAPAAPQPPAPAIPPAEPKTGLDALLEDAAADAESVNDVADLPDTDGEKTE
jgi:hypothetical protein